ncbi:beta-lactamase-like protein [Chytriomyces sp. MP71]|nr:beta-lactamase-like protein [Chytriomyces sp. MP71]
MHTLENRSSGANAPCWLLSMGPSTVLLDCALTHSQLGSYVLPQLSHEDISRIDTVLLSNHDSLLALPFVTENSCFRGSIYATDPTVLFGKLRLEDLVRSEPKVFDAHGATRRCFSLEDVHSCIAKIQKVRFNELSEAGPLTLNALSSGFALGACNWMMTYHWQKILYLSTSSFHTNTHASPINREPLKAADFVICNNGTGTHQAEATHPLALKRSAHVLFTEISRAIETGGTVVFLSKPFGVMFDLLELVEHAFATMGATGTVHVVSGAAKESLKVCNVLGEWMNKERQDTVFRSTLPLGHGAMMESKRLITHSSMHTLFDHKPQLVFLDYTDLDLNSFTAFFKWRQGGRCTYILTESESAEQIGSLFKSSRTDNPFLYCPFDTRASEKEYASLIQEVDPILGLVVPTASLTAFNNLSVGVLGIVPPGERMNVSLDSTKRVAKIAKAIAVDAEFIPMEGRAGGVVSCAPVAGWLELGHKNALRADDSLGGSSLKRKLVIGKVGSLERVANAALTEASISILFCSTH